MGFQSDSHDFKIRPAVEGDVPVILGLIRELAEFEKLSHEVEATEANLRDALFGERPVAEAILAELNQTPIGFALFFHNFSTFVGKPGLYLEDLYIKPEFRRNGFGRKMLEYLAGIAVERNCGRFEWTALDWNHPAINAYKKIGAVPMDEWTIFRLSGPALRKLAGR